MFKSPESVLDHGYLSPVPEFGNGKTGELSDGTRFEITAHKDDMILVRTEYGKQTLLERCSDYVADYWAVHALDSEYGQNVAHFWVYA